MSLHSVLYSRHTILSLFQSTMNNFFENHFEEINLITNRSKKESRISYTRLQKASIYKLQSINSEVVHENIYNLEGINVHQVTDDGKVLFGSSDRVYLPDVATRLYQGLDNILNSYKTHKVHSHIFKPKLDNDNYSNIENIDLSDWETEYFKEVLRNLFEDLSEESKSKFDIYFNLEGVHSLWQIFNPENKSKEFDEFLLTLNYKVEVKETSEIVLNKSKKIKVNDIRSKKMNFDEVVGEIDFAVKTYLNQNKKLEKSKTKPELIVLDSDLTSKVFLKLFNLNPKHKIFNKLGIKEVAEYNCVQESYDKFGNLCEEVAELNEKQNMPLRQTIFNSRPCFNYRNFGFANVQELFDEELKKDLNSVIDRISKKFKSKKILMMLGSKESEVCNEYCSDVIIQPALQVYFDSGKLNGTDIDFVSISDFDEMNLLAGADYCLNKLLTNNLYVGMSGFSYSVIPVTKDVKFI